MTKINKLIQQFRNKPRDFSYNELQRMLVHFGYEQVEAGGSRVIFINRANGHKMKLHKPHPGNILKRYQIDYVITELETKRLL